MIQGATTSTFVLTSAELGKYPYAVVSATGLDNSTSYKTSNMGGLVADPAINTVAPVMTDATSDGRYKTGDQLSVTSGTWTNRSGSFSYSWYRCKWDTTNPLGDSGCSLISGATSSTYTTSTPDAGKYMIAVVSTTGPDGNTINAASNSSGMALTGPAVNTVAPTIQAMPGTNYVSGDRLFLGTGTWTSATYTRTYKWYRCTATTATNPATDSTCIAIPGATSTQYTVRSNDVGKYLVATETATGTDNSTTTAKTGFTVAITAGSGGSGGSSSSSVCAQANSPTVCDLDWSYKDWSHVEVTWSAPNMYPSGVLIGYRVTNQMTSAVYCAITDVTVQKCSIPVTSQMNTQPIMVSVSPVLAGNMTGPPGFTPVAAGNLPSLVGVIGATGLGVFPNGVYNSAGSVLTFTVNGKTCTVTLTTGGGQTFSDDCASLDLSTPAGITSLTESGWLTPNTTYAVTGSYTFNMMKLIPSVGQTTVSQTLPFSFSFKTLVTPRPAVKNISAVKNNDGTYTISFTAPTGTAPLAFGV